MITKGMLAAIGEQEARLKNPLVLAYIGDSVYDLYVRTILIKKSRQQVNVLNHRAARVVNARAQAQAVAMLEQSLTEEEKEQRNPILSIEETREGYSVTVALSEAGKNNGDALVDLTVTDSGGNEVYFEKVAALEDEKHETAMVESVAVSCFSFSVLSVSV